MRILTNRRRHPIRRRPGGVAEIFSHSLSLSGSSSESASAAAAVPQRPALARNRWRRRRRGAPAPQPPSRPPCREPLALGLSSVVAGGPPKTYGAPAVRDRRLGDRRQRCAVPRSHTRASSSAQSTSPNSWSAPRVDRFLAQRRLALHDLRRRWKSISSGRCAAVMGIHRRVGRSSWPGGEGAAATLRRHHEGRCGGRHARLCAERADPV